MSLLRTICYYGSAPEAEMTEAVRRWADAHNATFEVRMARHPLRVGLRATGALLPRLTFPLGQVKVRG